MPLVLPPSCSPHRSHVARCPRDMSCFAPYALGSVPTLPPHSKNPGAAHDLVAYFMLWDDNVLDVLQINAMRISLDLPASLLLCPQTARPLGGLWSQLRHKFKLTISIRIEFYNKSITERLCTLNTATLTTRAHLAPKPAQNNLNDV